MGKSAKRMRKVQQSDISSSDDDDHHLESVEIEKFGSEDHTDSNNDDDDDDDDDDVEEEYDSEMDTMNFGNEEDVSGNEDSDSAGDANGDDDNESDEHDDDDDIDTKIDDNNHADMEELEKEYNDLRHEEQDLFRNLRHDQDDDLLKGQAVKNQRALWDKTLEFRFLLQKSFSTSNRLPQEPIRTSFCKSGEGVEEAYSDLIDSSKKTLDSILKLQEALIEKNPAIMEANDDGDAAQKSTSKGASKKSSEGDEEWFRISQMQSRIAPFRDMSVDKWQRKTQVTSGAAGIKNKFQAFNQNISEQVASYMRDPSRMIKGMQQRRSVVPVFGNVLDSTLDKDEVFYFFLNPSPLVLEFQHYTVQTLKWTSTSLALFIYYLLVMLW
ncbi:apoptosis-antagonizing transcription factor [Artemisia annua]|uniref:Apoptosis-antagonizing transcription factor n=1 Tax=Artemisia annua TaxID=35608 RepID=A0A2U1Q561_ARTAN|nr:apoptosis-antagonizing transcription factor [Artemisia annua]